MGIKVWLDDVRPAPDGWNPVRWPQDAIELLARVNVTHISLDHDLGDDARGTGYDVLLWIEQATMVGDFVPPVITVHSANVSARQKMIAAIAKIQRIFRSKLIYVLDEEPIIKILKTQAFHESIEQDDAVVITAGAGMGADSWLPEFRAKEGLWKANPALVGGC